jgi:hypothetical protein
MYFVSRVITVVAHTNGTSQRLAGRVVKTDAAVRYRYEPSFKQIISRGAVDLTARADRKRGQPELQMFYACSILYGVTRCVTNSAVIVESFVTCTDDAAGNRMLRRRQMSVRFRCSRYILGGPLAYRCVVDCRMTS